MIIILDLIIKRSDSFRMLFYIEGTQDCDGQKAPISFIQLYIRWSRGLRRRLHRIRTGIQSRFASSQLKRNTQFSLLN